MPTAPGHGFEIDPDAVAVAHERWQRDGPYSSLGGPMTGDSVSALHEWLQRVTFDDLPDERS